MVIVGVHTPEFEFEKDPQNVAAAAKRLGVDYPIALDNNYKTWQAYHNNYWPAHYLVDQEGNIRMEHFGEGGYADTENEIRELLGLAPLNIAEPQAVSMPVSPETYLGYGRGRSYIVEIKPGQTSTYAYYKSLGDDQVGLKGTWQVEEEHITPKGDDCYLNMNFLAKRVYLVLSGSSKEPIEYFLMANLLEKFTWTEIKNTTLSARRIKGINYH